MIDAKEKVSNDLRNKQRGGRQPKVNGPQLKHAGERMNLQVESSSATRQVSFK